MSGKNLRVLENGLVDGLGEKGATSEFTVISGAGASGAAIKFRNVAQPHFHLAIIKNFAVGYVRSTDRSYSE